MSRHHPATFCTTLLPFRPYPSPISPADFRISDEPTPRSDPDLPMGTEVVIFPLLDRMGTDGITRPKVDLPTWYEHWQPLPTPLANDHTKTAARCIGPHAVDDRCYRFFFFAKMSFQLSL
jgi:hypothetical protein